MKYLFFGSAFLVFGLGDYFRQTYIEQPEKYAYHILGHWVDSFWGIQVPSIIVGIILISIFVVSKFKK